MLAAFVLALVTAGAPEDCQGRGLAKYVTPAECSAACSATGSSPCRACCSLCRNSVHLACGGRSVEATEQQTLFGACMDKAREQLAAEDARQRAEAEREASEQKAAAQREEELRAETERARSTLHLDGPESGRYVSSLFLCHFQDLNRIAHAELEEERRASKIAGIINKSKLYELQKRIRLAEQGIDKSRKELGRAKPIACSSPGFDGVVECFRSEERDACDAPGWLAFRDFVAWE
jgi:hypothetical protein